MNKAFDLILERLEDFKDLEDDSGIPIHTFSEVQIISKCKEIVQEVAEEYNSGWILCSDMVPSDCEIHEVTAQFSNGRNYTEFAYYDEEMEEWWKFDDDVLLNVVAWKEQSEPYKHDGD